MGGLPRRHVLVLLNPFSGTKKAPKIWQSTVCPIFKEGGLGFEVIETGYAGHAKDIAKQVDLQKYDAILTVSGKLFILFVTSFLLCAQRGWIVLGINQWFVNEKGLEGGCENAHFCYSWWVWECSSLRLWN